MEVIASGMYVTRSYYVGFTVVVHLDSNQNEWKGENKIMAKIHEIDNKLYQLVPAKDNSCHGCAFWDKDCNTGCELPEDSEVMCDEHLSFKEFIPPTTILNK